jgi:hypothetical protein
MPQYYLSTTGNDANNGLSADSSWKTIAKVNTMSLNPGDEVLFHCGQIFPGELIICQSGTESQPILISSWGTGNKPILTGAIPVTGWHLEEGNRYSSNLNHTVFQLFVNDRLYHLARIPATGFFPIEKGDKSNLTDNRHLNVKFDLAGATARIRAVNWQYETAKVAAHHDGTITFTENMMYQCNPRYGYFLDNKAEFLNQPGQWFRDELSQKISIIPLAQENPDLQKVEATIYQNGITISEGVKYIRISGLQLEKYENAAISGLSNSGYVHISDCRIQDINVYGICLDINSGHYTIANNAITDIRGRGISTIESSYNEITGNELLCIGLYPGYGFNGVNNGVGIAILKTEVKFQISQSTFNQLNKLIIPSDILIKIAELIDLPYPDEKFVVEALENKLGKETTEKYSPLIMALVRAEAIAQKLESTHNRVAYNRVDSTGYAGIRVDGSNSIAEFNVIKNTLLHMNDGGALYCWAQNEDYTHHNIFRNNIIINAIGSCEATANDLAYAYGIYTDNKCHHITIENNTVVGAAGGILINDEGHHQKIVGNTLYDNRFGLVFSEYCSPGTLIGCEAYGNTLFCRKRDQRALFVESRVREGFVPGILNNNLYANPYYPFPIIALTYRNQVRTYHEYTLASWQKHDQQDADSTTIATANHDAGGQQSLILINETAETKSFDITSDLQYIDLKGNVLGNCVEVAAFSSLIILQV